MDPVRIALSSVGVGDMGESVSELEGGGQEPSFTLSTETSKLALRSSSQPLPMVTREIKNESPDSENDLNPVDINNYMDLQINPFKPEG